MDEALVQRVTEANADFLTLVRAIPPEAAAQPNLLGFWSAHEIVAHLIGWQEDAIGVLGAIRQGTYQPEEWDDDEHNAELVARRPGHTWDTLVNDLATTQAALVTLARSMPEDIRGQRLMARWLTGSTLNHYDEHRATLAALVGN